MPETSEYTRLGDGTNQSLFCRWQYLTRLEKGLILITTVFGIVIFSLAVALAKCDAQVPPTPSPTTVAPETTTTVKPTTITPTTVRPTTITPTTVTPTTVTPTTVTPTTVTPTTVTPTTVPSTTATPTTVTPTTTIKHEPETSATGNVKQLNTESSMNSDISVSENATKLLKNIPPIPVTGIKLIYPDTGETTTNNYFAETEETANNIVTSDALVQKYSDSGETTTNNYFAETEETANNIVTSDALVQKYSDSGETTTNNYFAETVETVNNIVTSDSEIPENTTEKSKRSSDPVLLRKKRIDMSSNAEGKKDNPIYE